MGGAGLRRSTTHYDVDLTILLDREELPQLFAAIDQVGYDVDDSYLRGWTDNVAGMPLVKAKTFVEGRTLVGDIFLAENPFQISLIERKLKLPVNSFQAWIASPEDIILLKLVASRHRDLGDVQDILFMQDQLDESYMRKWAAELDVSGALEQALREAQSN